MIRADIIYNNVAGREIAVALATRPSVPPPQMRGSWIDLGAVDGSMLSTDYTYENITIEAQLNFVCPPDKVGIQYRRVKDWIRGSGELSFTDDPEVYYRVKAAQVGEYSRRTYFGADLLAAFICDPYTYLKAGKYPESKSFAIQNTGTHLYLDNTGATAHPVYYISGGTSNKAATLSVNSKTFTVYRSDGIYIDTEKMMVYNGSGAQNFSSNGDFDDILLPNGTNDIKIINNDAAVTLDVTPNWRLL